MPLYPEFRAASLESVGGGAGARQATVSRLQPWRCAVATAACSLTILQRPELLPETATHHEPVITESRRVVEVRRLFYPF